MISPLAATIASTAGPGGGAYPRGMVERIVDGFGVTPTQARLLISVAVIVILVVLRLLVVTIVHRRIDDTAVWYRTRKTVSYLASIVGFLVVAVVWLEGAPVVTYLGFLTAALAIALSDVVKNVAGLFYIVIRHPFRLGDRIEIAGHRGDVIEIQLFRFTMLEVGGRVRQITGSMLHIPNGLTFTEPITNYSEGFEYIWHEIPVLVTFESDWEAAEGLVLAAVEEASAAISPERVSEQLRAAAAEYRLHLTDLAPTTIVTVEDSGILITGRLLVAARGGRRPAEQRVWRAILKSFAERDDIHFAYPTVRTYLEGPIQIAGE